MYVAICQHPRVERLLAQEQGIGGSRFVRLRGSGNGRGAIVVAAAGEQKAGGGEGGYDSGIHRGKIRLSRRKILPKSLT